MFLGQATLTTSSPPAGGGGVQASVGYLDLLDRSLLVRGAECGFLIVGIGPLGPKPEVGGR